MPLRFKCLQDDLFSKLAENFFCCEASGINDVDHDNDHIEEYYNLGCIYEEDGDIKAAREYFEKVFALDPEYKDIRERLSTAEFVDSLRERIERGKRANLRGKIQLFFSDIAQTASTRAKEAPSRFGTRIILIGIMPLLILAIIKQPVRLLTLPIQWGMLAVLIICICGLGCVILIPGMMGVGQLYIHFRNQRIPWVRRISSIIKK